jgi:hypothetical protein
MTSLLAKVLLGWMDEAEAMSTLLRENTTDPPLTESAAQGLWNEYRRRVKALPPRACPPPRRLSDRTPHERSAERWCVQEHCTHPQFQGVVKLDDPGRLVMHQLLIVVPESDKYLSAMQDSNRRVSVCLGRGLDFGGAIPRAQRRDQFLFKAMPHFEFTVPMANQEDFDVEEGFRAIAVKEFDGRMMLAAGAHRAHASMYRTNPEEMVRPLFAVLESDTVDGFFSEGTNAPAPFKRDLVRSACPPLLADFFDPRLCIQIPQRKRRLALWVDLNTREWYRDWEDAE